ncbi:MAG: coproporphyrinogen III oxidase family protein [Kiritimatiellae bacterium]|nr:coproporphyrinogen III oxidase family protein [Kiritimatiellia bacterium]
MSFNLYAHFPFCRRKCAYCALKSRAGASVEARQAYVARLADEVRSLILPEEPAPTTIYFGGGSPGLCDLRPLFDALRERGLLPAAEFTVELHPNDVSPKLLETLAAGGVNRVSLGIQSFDDATLAAMGRGHTAAEAIAAYQAVQRVFPNSGFDLIVGYPTTSATSSASRTLPEIVRQLAPAHVSVYTLIRELGTKLDLDVRKGRLALPDDDAALAEYARVAETLQAAGLVRYEISNWARPGAECRHNCAVWRGEDYVGLGDGAHGRGGLVRTVGEGDAYARETLSPESDALERALITLRTCFGFDPEAAVQRHPLLASRLTAWRQELDFAVEQGLARRNGNAYCLTSRGTEVCDAVLERLL